MEQSMEVARELKRSNIMRGAFILVKCSKTRHNDCRDIRDALIKGSSGYIQDAMTTNTVVDGTKWCVAVSALVPLDDADNFERRLKRIQTKDKKSVSVEKLKFMMDRR
ncbi:hypothetical protein CENSYa_0068 [Cenarchaeum symbiosum A]|uniref:Uncharacterized protein n=1 Tax=Cenarchaeum symbiosum (strain A) TaxID=414004 RepID=A0RTP7_CENSY|nr:hypothetical protein CENSYa_0068 [Cenarchaeum symbiosum A]